MIFWLGCCACPFRVSAYCALCCSVSVVEYKVVYSYLVHQRRQTNSKFTNLVTSITLYKHNDPWNQESRTLLSEQTSCITTSKKKKKKNIKQKFICFKYI